MGIRILPSNLINQIAAGEVIERPASAVKELVENALDAGATRVEVRLQNGGKTQIVVIDDGKGMNKEDLAVAVERHATSKLPTDDLFDVRFFGFRGEALPSIASVAKLRIASRCEAEDCGWQIEVEGGEKSEIRPCPRERGTTIEIRDLFFATPARLKFLKSDKSEVGACVDIINRIALANPQVTFLLFADDKRKILLSGKPGNSDEDRASRAIDVMGAEWADNTLQLKGEREGIRIHGLISLPTYNKASSLSEYFFVNNRPVRDKVLMGAFKAGYTGVLEVSRYPACVLFLDVDPMAVDVNVHPTKAEVRFFDQQGVRSLLVGSVKQTLLDGDEKCKSAKMLNDFLYDWAVELKNEKTTTADDVLSDNPEGYHDDILRENVGDNPVHNQVDNSVSSVGISSSLQGTAQSLKADFQRGYGSGYSASSGTSNYHSAPQSYSAPVYQARVATHNPQTEMLPELKHKFSVRNEDFVVTDDTEIGPLGVAKAQFHDTYILAQADDSLILIDQHAAHERIVLERLKAAFGSGERLASQMMLLPEVVDLSDSQKEALSGEFGNLAKLGLVLEEFGNEIAVKEVPALLKEPNLKKMVRDLADQTLEWGAATAVEDKINYFAATIACHGSVRAGRRLNVAEMNHLLREMEHTPHFGECNHGRPTFVRVEVSDLERLFHR